MKHIIKDIIAYENTHVLPESLHEYYKKFGEESLWTVASEVSGFVFQSSFPDDVLSQLPPAILSEQGGIKASFQSMLEVNSDFSSVFSINNKTNELEFSNTLPEEEKKEIIDYVKKNLQTDDIIPEKRHKHNLN